MTAMAQSAHRQAVPPIAAQYTPKQLTRHANRVYEALLNTQTILASDLRRFRDASGTLSTALILARSLERVGQPAMILHTPAKHAWVTSHDWHIDLGRLVPEASGLSVFVSKVSPTYDLRHPFQLRTDLSSHLAFDLPQVLEDEALIRAFLSLGTSLPGPVRAVTESRQGSQRFSCGHWVLSHPSKTRRCPYCAGAQPQ